MCRESEQRGTGERGGRGRVGGREDTPNNILLLFSIKSLEFSNHLT